MACHHHLLLCCRRQEGHVLGDKVLQVVFRFLDVNQLIPPEAGSRPTPPPSQRPPQSFPPPASPKLSRPSPPPPMGHTQHSPPFLPHLHNLLQNSTISVQGAQGRWSAAGWSTCHLTIRQSDLATRIRPGLYAETLYIYPEREHQRQSWSSSWKTSMPTFLQNKHTRWTRITGTLPWVKIRLRSLRFFLRKFRCLSRFSYTYGMVADEVLPQFSVPLRKKYRELIWGRLC